MTHAKLPNHEASYWISSVPDSHYPALKKDISVDVAIIGAGIAGLSVAYFLKQAGVKVAVFERNTVGTGVTGYTTGKVTSQHNLCCAKLQKNFGQDIARLYGEANQAAIEQMEKIITKENIACDWQRETNCVFTEKTEEVAKLKNEAEVAKKLGLPAIFKTKTPLPFAVKGAVCFTNQAKFHARKYLLGLARAVDGGESHFPGFGNAQARHQRLADYAKERFNISSIAYRWSTWDYLSNDNVPLIGKLYPWSKHAFVATGFMKWGLTTGTIAGMILTDAILDRQNPWTRVYDSSRLSPVTSIPKAIVKIVRSL